MLEIDIQNHFYNHKATEVLCLKNKMRYFIDFHQAFNWTTIQYGGDVFVMTTEGAHVGNLETGEMATIINSEILMNGAMAHGATATPHIESAHFDGQDLHLHGSDGITISSVDLSTVVHNSPYITDIDNNVQTVIGTVNLQNSMIKELKNKLESLQTKRKRITFAKQHKYKLK